MPKAGLVVAVLAVAMIIGAGGAGLSAAPQEQGNGADKPPVSEQAGEITFNTQTGAVGASPEVYEVPAGHQLELTLSLRVNGGGTAEFATPPVRFPHGEPPQLRWRRNSPTEVVVIELNDNQAPGTTEAYYFKARVESGGSVHESPDPSIVNVGPPGDG